MKVSINPIQNISAWHTHFLAQTFYFFLHENEIFIHENNISMHENDNLATGMNFLPPIFHG